MKFLRLSLLALFLHLMVTNSLPRGGTPLDMYTSAANYWRASFMSEVSHSVVSHPQLTKNKQSIFGRVSFHVERFTYCKIFRQSRFYALQGP
jgi:hypothetical protein